MMVGLREAPELEKMLGIEFYLTCQDGIGGRIRTLLEDFVVREVLRNGLRADFSLPWP
ncbi:MAG TPA: tRNA pseudouridine(13) synthase TruD, partial [Candidatus Bathyarchaeota archaeon]|nr:tRNA pseudouridine(13) synthase TruD [Candidatus Bathyarchaeota archaeon]HEW89850.1 tRNA pseudouridine(13) synthase TruD [Candidatus Bathyarchaeota archaeon]